VATLQVETVAVATLEVETVAVATLQVETAAVAKATADEAVARLKTDGGGGGGVSCLRRLPMPTAVAVVVAVASLSQWCALTATVKCLCPQRQWRCRASPHSRHICSAFFLSSAHDLLRMADAG
jgi:hypothetical protein